MAAFSAHILSAVKNRFAARSALCLLMLSFSHMAAADNHCPEPALSVKEGAGHNSQ